MPRTRVKYNAYYSYVSYIAIMQVILSFLRTVARDDVDLIKLNAEAVAESMRRARTIASILHFSDNVTQIFVRAIANTRISRPVTSFFYFSFSSFDRFSIKEKKSL